MLLLNMLLRVFHLFLLVLKNIFTLLNRITKNVLLKLYTELYNSKRTFKSKYLRQKSTIVNSYIYIRKSFL